MIEPYFSDEWSTIYHGDCRDILPHITADIAVMDPPYGIGFPYPSYDDTVDTDIDGWTYLDCTPTTMPRWRPPPTHGLLPEGGPFQLRRVTTWPLVAEGIAVYWSCRPRGSGKDSVRVPTSRPGPTRHPRGFGIHDRGPWTAATS